MTRAQRFRVVAVRFKNGQTHEMTIQEPIAAQIAVPVLMTYFDPGSQAMRQGFGQDIYEWNGTDMTVSGLPLYR